MDNVKNDTRRVFHKLATVEEALSALEGRIRALECEETVPTRSAIWRVASKTVFSQVDLPPFDRAEMDGYAVVSSDLEGASEISPKKLVVLGRVDAGGAFPGEVVRGGCVEIATGAQVPRGADSVLMVEYTSKSGGDVEVYKPVTPGENIAYAGSDIERGEILLRKGTVIGVEEVALLSAAGVAEISVYRKPRVGILSTGDELIEPGSLLSAGKIYDANSNMLMASVQEAGGDPVFVGRAKDELEEIRGLLKAALEVSDLVLISGGTSAGLGDIVYKVLEECDPGVIVHGLQVKPGKPTVIALDNGKPVIGLPGYPVSALMIFNQIVRPLIQRMGGIARSGGQRLGGRLAQRVNAAKGKRWFLPVHILRGEGIRVYPIFSGSGAIGTMARADGYITLREGTEYLEEGEEVEVSLFRSQFQIEGLVIMGSHCPALDSLLELIFEKEGIRSKAINVGSMAGLSAVVRGECDLAGVHLLDEATMVYNAPFVKRAGLPDWCLVRGYRRLQGIAVPSGNPKGIRCLRDIIGSDLIFANRNRGSGTRVLTDRILNEIATKEGIHFSKLVSGIRGYRMEARTHSSVAAAVYSGKADLGVCIKTAADAYGLDFIPIAEEEYDFVANPQSYEKYEVKKFIEYLGSDLFNEKLRELGGYSMSKADR
ncbi:MAG: molybdopterin biosynthesis protein [Candidatus Verstraetearchaeota archaeon]|nr:molybdopterin biosynthesis protein [Candidatus Verstraetearchaeota archaeon]